MANFIIIYRNLPMRVQFAGRVPVKALPTERLLATGFATGADAWETALTLKLESDLVLIEPK